MKKIVHVLFLLLLWATLPAIAQTSVEVNTVAELKTKVSTAVENSVFVLTADFVEDFNTQASSIDLTINSSAKITIDGANQTLKAALDKFNVLHRQQANYSRLESIISQLQPKTKERFLIKIGEHYRSVQTLSIHCFFIMERNTFIQTDTGKTYPIDYSLDKIEQLVDPGQFFRINRNFIVNFSAIQDILIYSSGRLKIILNGWTEKEDILVSRERVTEFKEWMDR